MKHKPLHHLRDMADIDAASTPLLTRGERLERWAEILERDPGRILPTLGDIEFLPRAEQHAARAEGSALSVAFADPLLRSAGLASDRLGDAMAFFTLSDGDAHRILCSCLNGRRIEARLTAKRVRALAHRKARAPALAGWGLAAAAGVPGLLYLLG